MLAGCIAELSRAFCVSTRMRAGIFTCLFIDTDGAVVDVLRFSAPDPVEAARHAAKMAAALGEEISVELRRAGRKVNPACTMALVAG